MILFISSIIGIIVIVIGTFFLDVNNLTPDDKTLYSILLILVFLFPLVIIFYMLYTGEYYEKIKKEYNECDPCLPKPCNKNVQLKTSNNNYTNNAAIEELNH